MNELSSAWTKTVCESWYQRRFWFEIGCVEFSRTIYVPSSEKPQYQLNDALYLVKHLMGLKRLPLVQAALLRHYNKAENLKLKAENSDKV